MTAITPSRLFKNLPSTNWEKLKKLHTRILRRLDTESTRQHTDTEEQITCLYNGTVCTDEMMNGAKRITYVREARSRVNTSLVGELPRGVARPGEATVLPALSDYGGILELLYTRHMDCSSAVEALALQFLKSSFRQLCCTSVSKLVFYGRALLSHISSKISVIGIWQSEGLKVWLCP